MSGHYYTVARHNHPAGSWWYYNDTVRRAIRNEDIDVRTPQGFALDESYVLFYERRLGGGVAQPAQVVTAASGGGSIGCGKIAGEHASPTDMQFNSQGPAGTLRTATRPRETIPKATGLPDGKINQCAHAKNSSRWPSDSVNPIVGKTPASFAPAASTTPNTAPPEAWQEEHERKKRRLEPEDIPEGVRRGKIGNTACQTQSSPCSL